MELQVLEGQLGGAPGPGGAAGWSSRTLRGSWAELQAPLLSRWVPGGG